MFRLPWYAKAVENRLKGHDKEIAGDRRRFLKAAFLNFAILQLLFLGLFSYIFGAIYDQASSIHKMDVLYVDYDAGLIGKAVRSAYHTLEAPTFPNIKEASPSRYPTPEDIEKDVCNTHYWAAIYTSPGATTRLETALAGGSAAEAYNRSDVVTYIWNEARYSTVQDTDISATLATLATTAQMVYTTINGTGALGVLDTNDTAAISVFANPWTLTDVNIQETVQGARLIYNTLVIILILIQEFFFLSTINGLYASFKFYERLYPLRIVCYRNMISLSYCCAGSISVAGAIWAFKDGWKVNGNQFALTWLVLWLFAHVNFLTLDVFAMWLPAVYIPMALVAWIVFNVTSILVPFDIAPSFYKWSYMIPAHSVYNILGDIWSRGCNPVLAWGLPVLFGYELSGLVLSGLGIYRRCHYALIADENQKAAFKERVDEAMAFERKRNQERIDTPMNSNVGDTERADEIEREELGSAIRREDSEARNLRRIDSKVCNFGPSFELHFVD